MSVAHQRTPRLYRFCDGATEALLYCMVVLTPWAFGTTQEWSIWTMTAAGYLLGALLTTKWLIRWRLDYQPPRWATGEHRWLTHTLAALTVAILAWCLVSAVNARAAFAPDGPGFDYREHYIPWLPHSYEAGSTWFAFWMYSGLACAFWAMRDWLQGKTRHERHATELPHREAAEPTLPQPAPAGPLAFGLGPLTLLPVRLRRLLWLLCLNGALLGAEGIFQRLDGTNKLLWLVQPRLNQNAESQFGPYAYRSNAAQYLNLVWPVCFAFWWTQKHRYRSSVHRTRRAGGSPHVLLLPCAVLMAAGPIISTSRGGALVAAGLMLSSTLVFIFASQGRLWLQLSIFAIFLAALTLGGYLGWEKLRDRLRTVFTDKLSNRLEIYRNAQLMAADYGWLGSGPRTFGRLYPLYVRKDAERERAWYLHDDWLETRISFGTLGLGLILAAFCFAALRWFLPGGIPAPWPLTATIWLALAGCLVHARFDFPLQIYSVLFVFLTLCCMLSLLSRSA